MDIYLTNLLTAMDSFCNALFYHLHFYHVPFPMSLGPRVPSILNFH
ncbi:Protein of unknown function [Pyronema omphalodes CBS 100304]|uniref:Uncharacterized protein n=1 Tax=Pyronema omphalodes (strain CBS 100304) TaxID=1076935 RepID=U4LBT4_PYROM|nr:Protein of unknown function [Pyronema omphalodes CBS 100304]